MNASKNVNRSWRVLLVIAAGVSCAHPPKSEPVPAPRAPAPVVVAPAPIESWKMASALPATRYLSSVIGTLERDSAGRVLREQVESRAIIVLRAERDSLGALRGSGLVDSFTVRGLERALASNNGTTNANSNTIVPALPLVVAFDAVLDATTSHVTTRPPLANECDRPESGATSMVRELLVRIPRTLTVGMTWRDSTVSYMCRLGVPIISRTIAQHVVERAEQVDGRTELVIRRKTDTQLEGNLRTAWRVVMLSGNGRANQQVRVDVAGGTIRSIDGEGTLAIRFSDSARRDTQATQEVRQSTRSHIVLRPTNP